MWSTLCTASKYGGSRCAQPVTSAVSAIFLANIIHLANIYAYHDAVKKAGTQHKIKRETINISLLLFQTQHNKKRNAERFTFAFLLLSRSFSRFHNIMILMLKLVTSMIAMKASFAEVYYTCSKSSSTHGSVQSMRAVGTIFS